jgi:anthranilate 1,2-dioxygenase small subunit
MPLEAVVRRLELEQLYTDYVHCLDDDELERWPDFFTDDCFYRVTSAENYEAGMPLGADPCDLAQDPEGPGQRAARSQYL